MMAVYLCNYPLNHHECFHILSIEYNSYGGSLVMGIALPLLTGPALWYLKEFFHLRIE